MFLVTVATGSLGGRIVQPTWWRGRVYQNSQAFSFRKEMSFHDQ